MTRRALAALLLFLPLAGSAEDPPKAQDPPKTGDSPKAEEAPAERIAIPGTRLLMTLPEDFALSDSFSGIVHEETGASILVSVIPAPSRAIRAAMSREQLAAGGITTHELRQLDFNGREATLVYASQVSGGTPFRKWLLVFGDEQTTVSLVAMVPVEHEKAMRPVLLEVLRATDWDPARQVDLFAGLAFTLEETESLRVTERVARMLFLTRPRDGAPLTQGDPLFIVGTASDDETAADLAELSRKKLLEITEVEKVVFVGEKAAKLDGLPAWETVADAVDAETQHAMVVYQLLARNEGDGVILMQGLVGAEQADRYLSEFRRVAASFRRAPRSD